MKTVFCSNEIAHIWFHAQAPYGGSPSSMLFDGDVFLSYNTAIARKVTHKGKVAVILNDRHFSNTTSKHFRKMRGAIPQDTIQFHFDDGMGTRLDVSPVRLFDYAIKHAAKALINSQKPRIRQTTRDSLLAHRQWWLSEAQKVSNFFGLRRKVDAEAQKRVEEEEREALESWLKGEPIDNYRVINSSVHLRLYNGNVETTKGIAIPLDEARLAFRFISRHRANGWKRNGEQYAIAGFQLDTINEFGIVAGCHRITWEEIDRFAALMEWNTANETVTA